MKNQVRFRRALFLLLLVACLAASSIAEARIGGGRSSGSRGFRGFGTRATSPAPNYSQGSQQQQPSGLSQQQSRSQGTFANPGPSSGGFMRGLLGGLAGGMIGSMLFGGISRAGGFGGGGIGMLEILLLAGLGFLTFRIFSGRKPISAGAHREMSHDERLRGVERGPFALPTSPMTSAGIGDEHACANVLSKYNSGFSLATFKEERMDDFMKLQAAWNHRDLSGVSKLIGPELMSQLGADIAQLKAQGQVNRVENIAVRSNELVEAWQERGQEFATVRFRANVTDYTIDEASGQIVGGDRFQPVKFEEDWTFVRAIDDGMSPSSWKVTAIEA